MWSAFVRGAWRKLPVETLIVGMAAIGAIGFIHTGDDEIWGLWLLLAGVLVTPLAVAAHRLGRRRQALVIAATTAGVLAAVIIALPDADALSRATFSWGYRLALLAAVLVPFVAAAPRFTAFVRRFFEETTTWGLLYLCALAAIAVIGLALHELFDLRLARLGPDAVTLLTAGFVLVYLDRLVADDPATPGRMPELWRRLATAIGAPFVTIMLAILVAYEAVVLARGELPSNMLSPLILAAGFAGFVSTLILSSVLGEAPTGTLAPADPHRWARRPTIRLVRAFPVVLLLLLPMAGWALRVRIEEYGFTPFRVVRAMGLLCLITLSLAGTLRWWRGRPPLSWQVPATIVAFAVAAAFGPVSAVGLSIDSQAARLAHQLDAAGIPRVVHATSATSRIQLDREALYALEAAIQGLAALDGESALRRVLTGAVSQCARTWDARDCLDRLGVEERGRDDLLTFDLDARGRFATEAGTLELVQRDRAWNEPPLPPRVTADPSEHIALLADAVVIHARGVELARASLTELMDRRLTDRVLPPRPLPLRRADGTVIAQLAVHHLTVHANRTAAQVVRLTGVMIWPP
jgi:hypothetical protein